eukprot:CAMPEP_0198700158 /NCGR_PEP_ID=MMETSP1468-20131203/365141_1 /TAXON_ID=1461545 /ORGANISM="Mantoniella sp, Strain CCMP1436" /LENGTH=173 /DNA_ID=CAMNT_0044457967 /DNA_START=35 /DNA_END=556 /DNA_ORIENTATION=-
MNEQDAIYGVLYTLSKEKASSSFRTSILKLLVDFAQLIVFYVDPAFGWGFSAANVYGASLRQKHPVYRRECIQPNSRPIATTYGIQHLTLRDVGTMRPRRILTDEKRVPPGGSPPHFFFICRRPVQLSASKPAQGFRLHGASGGPRQAARDSTKTSRRPTYDYMSQHSTLRGG